MDATRFLVLDEVRSVLDDLHRRAHRSANSRLNLAIFRLACCCGLRRKEIAGLLIGDLVLSGSKPALRVRKAITKGQEMKRRARMVPLWWDAGTLDDLRQWVEYRKAQGAATVDRVVCGQGGASFGKPLPGDQLARHWKTAIRAIGPERVRQVSIHGGRHSFGTLSLAAGRSLVEVQRAMGHSNVATTSIYLHLVEREGVPDVFSRSET